MSDKSSNPIDFSMCPKICHSARPNMVTYGIWQPSLINSYTQRYTVAQTKHKKNFNMFIYKLCCLLLSRLRDCAAKTLVAQVV